MKLPAGSQTGSKPSSQIDLKAFCLTLSVIAPTLLDISIVTLLLNSHPNDTLLHKQRYRFDGMLT